MAATPFTWVALLTLSSGGLSVLLSAVILCLPMTYQIKILSAVHAKLVNM